MPVIVSVHAGTHLLRMLASSAKAAAPAQSSAKQLYQEGTDLRTQVNVAGYCNLAVPITVYTKYNAFLKWKIEELYTLPYRRYITDFSNRKNLPALACVCTEQGPREFVPDNLKADADDARRHNTRDYTTVYYNDDDKHELGTELSSPWLLKKDSDYTFSIRCVNHAIEHTRTITVTESNTKSLNLIAELVTQMTPLPIIQKIFSDYNKDTHLTFRPQSKLFRRSAPKKGEWGSSDHNSGKSLHKYNFLHLYCKALVMIDNTTAQNSFECTAQALRTRYSQLCLYMIPYCEWPDECKQGEYLIQDERKNPPRCNTFTVLKQMRERKLHLPYYVTDKCDQDVQAADGPEYEQTQIKFKGMTYTIPTTQPYLGMQYKIDSNSKIECTLIAAGSRIENGNLNIFRRNLSYTITLPRLTTLDATLPNGDEIQLPVRTAPNSNAIIVTYTLTEFEQYLGQCYFRLHLTKPERQIMVVLLAPNNNAQVRNRHFKNTEFNGTFTPFLYPPRIQFKVPDAAGPRFDEPYSIELAAPPT